MAPIIAHYYCELAEKAGNQAQFEQMNRYLKQASQVDHKSVRTPLLQAKQAYDAKQYQIAARYYQDIRNKSPEFTAEILLPLARCYEACGEQEEFQSFLQRCLQEELGAVIFATFSHQLTQYLHDPKDIKTIATQLQKRPSMRAIYALIELRLKDSEGEESRHLMQLRDIVQQLLNKEAPYYCEQCGFAAQALYWLCPSCKHWGVIKPFSGHRLDSPHLV
jgi:lipopolysaccharide biosynthesis regulator YciM